MYATSPGLLEISLAVPLSVCFLSFISVVHAGPGVGIKVGQLDFGCPDFM